MELLKLKGEIIAALDDGSHVTLLRDVRVAFSDFEDNRDTDGKQIVIDLAEYEALVENANRFVGLRNIICMTDEAKRDRIVDAIDLFVTGQADFKTMDAPTPERVNELVDGMIALAGAQDADG